MDIITFSLYYCKVCYAICYCYSTTGVNVRYLSFKYDISPISWISPLCTVYKCINDYETDCIVTPDVSYIIGELFRLFRLGRLFYSNKYTHVSVAR